MSYKKYVTKAKKFARSKTGKAIGNWAAGYSLGNQNFDFGGIGQSDLGLGSSDYSMAPGYGQFDGGMSAPRVRRAKPKVKIVYRYRPRRRRYYY
jgi:hypothetical protein